MHFTVGILRGTVWVPLPTSPSFDTKAEAEVWAKDYIAAHPEVTEIGLEAIHIRPLRL